MSIFDRLFHRETEEKQEEIKDEFVWNEQSPLYHEELRCGSTHWEIGGRPSLPEQERFSYMVLGHPGYTDLIIFSGAENIVDTRNEIGVRDVAGPVSNPSAVDTKGISFDEMEEIAEKIDKGCPELCFDYDLRELTPELTQQVADLVDKKIQEHIQWFEGRAAKATLRDEGEDVGGIDSMAKDAKVAVKERDEISNTEQVQSARAPHVYNSTHEPPMSPL